VVIDRPDLNQPSCHSAWQVVFGDMMERDAERNAAFAASA